jgi:hypothetical protein
MPIFGSQAVTSWGLSEPKKRPDNQPYPFGARGRPYPPPAFEFGEAMGVAVSILVAR